MPTRGSTPGYLQLTDASNNAAGSVLYNRPIPASAGISITLRQFQYGGTGADGIGFFLVDGATNLTATGANGGSLGYAQKDGTQQGVKGGYVGVGFDAYGNYYNDGESRGTGCPAGQRSPTSNSGPIAPNVITVRGPGNGLTGYCYQDATVPRPITNPNAPGTTLAFPLRAATLALSEREVNVTVTPDVPAGSAEVIVQIRYHPQVVGDPWVQVLRTPAPAGIPSTYKFGLSASTGGSTDVHLVSLVQVATVTPLNALQLVKQVDRSGTALPAVIAEGATIPYQFTVTNAGLEDLQTLSIVDSKITGTITCDHTTLTPAPAVGSTAVCKGSYQVTAADVTSGSVINIATAHANPVTPPSTDVVSNPSSVTIPLSSSLSLLKSVVTPGPYSVGQSVAYRYDLTNTGGSQLVNVAVADNRLTPPARATCPSNQLAPAATMPCVATYIVKAGDVGPDGVLVNTAVATAQTEIGQQVTSNPSQGRINVFTDVGVAKTVDNAAPLVGSNVTYTVTATNFGPSLAQQVVVTDLLPQGQLAIAAPPITTPGTTYEAATGKWSIPSLAVNATVTLTIVATVLSNAAVTNSATRTAMIQTDINPANDSASVTISPVPTVDLAVTKSVDVADMPVGGTAHFAVTVRNLGPSPASGVTLLDTLPDNLSFVPGGSGGDGTYDPVSGVWTVGGLAVGASATYTIAVTSSQLGTYTNIVVLTGSSPVDNNSANNSGTAALTVRAVQADLYVSKGVIPEQALVGDTVAYQVEIGNKGPEAVDGVFVVDTAPPGLALSPTPPLVSKGELTFPPGNDIRWDVGRLEVGEIAKVTLYAVIETAGTKVNTAKIDAPDLDDPTPADNIATATLTTDLRQVDVGVTKTVTANSGAPIDRVPLGQDVTFVVTATNHSTTEPATNVVLQDLLDPELQLGLATPDVGTTYDSATGEWTIPTLAPEASFTLTIVARAATVGQSGNSISLASLDQSDTNPSNNFASATINVVDEADLSITKANSPAVAQPGDSVVYTITIANDGPNDAVDVVGYDPFLIDALITDFDAPAGTTFDPATRVWNIPRLANGASVALTVTVLVRPGRTGTFVNTVVVSSLGEVDPNPANNVATASLFIPSADIVVTKRVDRPNVLVGEQVVFTIGLDNVGPDTASAVAVRDLLPAGLTFVSATPSVGTYDAITGVWTVGDVDPIQLPRTRAVGTGATLQIVARADAVGTSTNNASSDRTSSFPFDPDPTNNSASAAVTVSPQPADLSVTKVVSAAEVTVGESLTFTIVVSNAAPARRRTWCSPTRSLRP